jgi:hypothetical protein
VSAASAGLKEFRLHLVWSLPEEETANIGEVPGESIFLLTDTTGGAYEV